MPWLSSVKGVLEAWYPGQEDGSAIAALLFGSVDPSGHLTVTFPTSLSQVPASTTAQWPGANGTVQYSEGVDVGYRWYDSQSLTPLFPFGYGLSYTTFAFSNLKVGTLPDGGAATVTAHGDQHRHQGGRRRRPAVRVRSGRVRPAAPAAGGLPAGQPAARRQPDRHLPAHPAEPAVLELDQQRLGDQSTGNYGIDVGDSDANLPLTGTLNVSSAQLGQPVTITSPGVAGRTGGHRRVRAGIRERQQQRADADVHRDRAARRDVDLAAPARSPARRRRREPPRSPSPPRTAPARSGQLPRSPGRCCRLATGSRALRWSATRACAWTSPATTTPTAPRWTSIHATAPTASSGPGAGRDDPGRR